MSYTPGPLPGGGGGTVDQTARDSVTSLAASLPGAYAPKLVATATKTAAYTAAVGDLAVMNVAGGATALTLPPTPANKDRVGFRALGATTGAPLTVSRNGAGITIGTAGATSVTVPIDGEVTVYEYDAANTRWLPVENVKPLSSLKTYNDGLYDPTGAAAARYPLADPSALTVSPDGVSKTGLWTPERVARPLPPPSKVITRFPSGHGWTGGADDTATFLYGDRSFTLTSAGAGANTYETSPTLTAVDCSGSIFRLVFLCSDPTKLNQLSIVATSTSGNAYQGNVQQNAVAGEFCIATISRAQFTVASGTPSWSSITKFDIRFKDIGGSNPVTIKSAALELLPDQAATYPNGVFVFEADDGYSGQLANLLPVVSARGIPVTYNVITDRFLTGSPASGMTAADLRTLQNKHGWQVSCHAYATAAHNGTPSTVATMEADFQTQKQWLHANGLHSGADDLALCPGTGSPVAEGAMMEAIRRSFRSARVNSGFYETVTPGDPLKLRSILFSGNTNSQLQTNIDAVAGAGGALILTVHDVLTGATNGTSNSLPAIAATNLATVLDYAAGKGMAFRTRGDYLERR